MIYPYDCELCGRFEVMKSMADSGREENCPECEHVARRIYTAPHVMNPTSQLPIVGGGHNTSKGRRTPDQQEKVEGQIIDRNRKLAQRKQRESGRKPDGDFRMLGQIPRALFETRKRQFGKRYWEHQEPREALAREGLKFTD